MGALPDLDNIIGISLAFIFTALIAVYRDRLYKLFFKFFLNKGGRSELPWKSFREKHDQINILLSELRVLSESDRVYIYQFHNGGYFLPGNSAWRVTNTFEVCGRGISYQGQYVQGTPITRLWDVLSCMFPSGEKTNSILAISHEILTEKGVLLGEVQAVNTSELPLGFARNFLEGSHTEIIVLTPLFDDNKNIIGCLCLDYYNMEHYNNSINTTPLIFNSIMKCAGLIGVILSVKEFSNLDK
jgi:hypothetical protein